MSCRKLNQILLLRTVNRSQSTVVALPSHQVGVGQICTNIFRKHQPGWYGCRSGKYISIGLKFLFAISIHTTLHGDHGTRCTLTRLQLREADECFQMALAIAKRMQPPNQQLVDIATTARAQTQQLAQELQQMALQAQSQAQAQSQMQGREGADSQEQSDGGSFLSR